jgi:hypothetical protein
MKYDTYSGKKQSATFLMVVTETFFIFLLTIRFYEIIMSSEARGEAPSTVPEKETIMSRSYIPSEWFSLINNPEQRGEQVEGTVERYASFSRYRFFPVHTRFDSVCVAIYDAMSDTPTLARTVLSLVEAEFFLESRDEEREE